MVSASYIEYWKDPKILHTSSMPVMLISPSLQRTRCTSAEKAWLLEASQRLEKAMPKEHAQASRPAVRPQASLTDPGCSDLKSFYNT